MKTWIVREKSLLPSYKSAKSMCYSVHTYFYDLSIKFTCVVYKWIWTKKKIYDFQLTNMFAYYTVSVALVSVTCKELTHIK